MKQTIKVQLTLLFGFSAVFQANAQETTSFTLEAAKQYALEHHVEIKNANYDVTIAEQKVKETIGMGLPQIDFKGNFNHFINIPVQVVDASAFNPSAPEGELMEFRMGTDFNASGALSLNQLIFNGSYMIGLKAADYYANTQGSISDLTKENIVFNAIQAYQFAAVAKGNKAFADSLFRITETLVTKQKNYLELGLMLQEDMDQLNYSLIAAQNAVVSADIQYQNALNRLKISIGYPIENNIEISQTADDLLTLDNISSGDLTQNLQYIVLEKKVKLADYNVKNNQYANLPSLYGFFSQTYNAYRNEFNFFANEKWYPQTVWGLQLTVPIFSGLSRHYRTEQAKVALLKDQASFEQISQVLKYQELEAQNNLRGAKEKFALQQANIQLAQTIYDNAITKEQIGKGNMIQVTQKYNQLMMAQAQYLGAMMDMFQAQLALDKIYNNILSNQ